MMLRIALSVGPIFDPIHSSTAPKTIAVLKYPHAMANPLSRGPSPLTNAVHDSRNEVADSVTAVGTSVALRWSPWATGSSCSETRDASTRRLGAEEVTSVLVAPLPTLEMMEAAICRRELVWSVTWGGMDLGMRLRRGLAHQKSSSTKGSVASLITTRGCFKTKRVRCGRSYCTMISNRNATQGVNPKLTVSSRVVFPTVNGRHSPTAMVI